MHKVTTVFGERATRIFHDQGITSADEDIAQMGGGAIVEREFETEAEKIAYLRGLEDAGGWADYAVYKEEEL